MLDLRTAAYGATALRITLGLMFISHAYLKFAIFTVPGFEGYLAAQGLPTFLAWPIVLGEFIGGTAILVGFYGRVVSLALIPLLVGALMVHAPNGWVFNVAGGGWEYPAFLAMAAFAQGLLGDGAFALKSVTLSELIGTKATPRAA
ncbi:DoxX family protein [Azorhizobium caulinodans]|nr:DoxX family protein [Azorhizobium caulinodans]